MNNHHELDSTSLKCYLHKKKKKKKKKKKPKINLQKLRLLNTLKFKIFKQPLQKNRPVPAFFSRRFYKLP